MFGMIELRGIVDQNACLCYQTIEHVQATFFARQRAISNQRQHAEVIKAICARRLRPDLVFRQVSDYGS